VIDKNEQDDIEESEEAEIARLKLERDKEANELSARHEYILNMAALGIGSGDISRTVGIKLANVSTIVNDPKNKDFIRQKQSEIFKEPKAKLAALYDKAWATLDDALSDNEEKMAVRVDVAKYVIDHTIGKPQQTVEHKGNMLNEILLKIERGDLKDVIEATKTNLLEKPKNKMDAIMEALELDDVVIGKRGEIDGES
jgi:hypothetical protein